jgi:hypothetical protein
VVDDIRSLFDKLTSSRQSRAAACAEPASEANKKLAELASSEQEAAPPLYLDSSQLSTFKQRREREKEHEQDYQPVTCLSKIEQTKLKLSQSFQSSADLVLKRSLATHQETTKARQAAVARDG